MNFLLFIFLLLIFTIKGDLCVDCTSSNTSGWCKNKEECVPGSALGPSGDSCGGDGGNWVYTSGFCKGKIIKFVIF